MSSVMGPAADGRNVYPDIHGLRASNEDPVMNMTGLELPMQG